VLRRRDGAQVAVLEQAIPTELPTWFAWPEPFTVKAADGQTDLHGLLFFPPEHDPTRTYPLIDLIYGGPQINHTPVSGFMDPVTTGTLCEAAGYAQLGGFAVILDGRGTAMRDRAFRHHSLGAVQLASDLADHEVAIRTLAQRESSIDLARVGMTGFSGGGYATTMAAFTRGDFFGVTVAGGGNYDQALFWHGWGERYHGAFDEDLYAEQAAKTYAAGLQGKLMLIHGLLDSGCHPSGLFAVLQALVEANKDVDLVLLPQAAHAMPGYAVRRRLDHFVRHLFGEQPPRDISLAGPHDLLYEKLTQQRLAAE
jgi:dipeptidyl aminopeptidase/acylaminoacyl peptidase